MSVIWWILFAVIWIAIAFWPARVAGRKGHSFIGYFIFSLFFFPAALIVAYLVGDRTRAPRRGKGSCQLAVKTCHAVPRQGGFHARLHGTLLVGT